MLTITAKQMANFEDAARADFVCEVAVYLRSHVPAELIEDMDEAALLAWIGAMHRNAAAYGVQSRRALALWAFLAVVLGHEFHVEPTIRHYLEQPTPDVESKIDVLAEALEERLRLRDG